MANPKTHTYVDPDPLDPEPVEGPRYTVEVLDAFFTNGAMMLPGDTVKNLPSYNAHNLVNRGKAKFADGAA